MNTKSTFLSLAVIAILFTGCSSSTDALRNIGGHKEDIIVNKPENRNPNADVDARNRATDAIFNIGGHKEDIIVNKPD